MLFGKENNPQNNIDYAGYGYENRYVVYEMHIVLFCRNSFIVGTSAAIYVFFTKSDPIIRIRESRLKTMDIFQIYTLRAIHYSIFAFFSLYPFIVDFNLTHDLVVSSMIASVYFQWRIFGGCIIVILEKRVLFRDDFEENRDFKLPFLVLLNVPRKITEISDNLVFLQLIALGLRIWYSFILM